MTFQPAHPDLIDRMSRLEHFSKLSQADLAAIIDIGRVRKVDEGEWIFGEGEPCAGLYVLLSGQVHLHKVGPEGQEHIMVVLKPVTMFNEVAVLDGGVNPATAIAARESVVWRADREEFLGLIDQYPAVGIGMLPILARRNRELVTKFEDLSFRTVRARTAKLLLELSRLANVPSTVAPTRSITWRPRSAPRRKQSADPSPFSNSTATSSAPATASPCESRLNWPNWPRSPNPVSLPTADRR